jgi:hypothetical protein
VTNHYYGPSTCNLARCGGFTERRQLDWRPALGVHALYGLAAGQLFRRGCVTVRFSGRQAVRPGPSLGHTRSSVAATASPRLGSLLSRPAPRASNLGGSCYRSELSRRISPWPRDGIRPGQYPARYSPKGQEGDTDRQLTYVHDSRAVIRSSGMPPRRCARRTFRRRVGAAG